MAIRVLSAAYQPAAGPKLTVKDIEEYIAGLAQNGTTPKNDPYTVYPKKGKSHTLTEAQLAASMKAVGYSPQQITSIEAGKIPGGTSWITNALKTVAGGAASVPDVGPAAGDIIDLLTGASDASSLANPADAAYAPEETIARNEQAVKDSEDATAAKDSTAASKAVTQIGTGSALTGIWDLLSGDAKYIGIWIGLMILGVVLILMGLNKSGAKVPTPPIVVAP